MKVNIILDFIELHCKLNHNVYSQPEPAIPKINEDGSIELLVKPLEKIICKPCEEIIRFIKYGVKESKMVLIADKDIDDIIKKHRPKKRVKNEQ